MPYKYQIEKGQEHRIFGGARNLGDGTVESDEPLNSAYLTLVDNGEASQSLPAEDEVKAPPVAPVPPATPPAPAPVAQPSPAQTPKEETN
jgi:hypothetical protein